ncbi:MAG: HDOD domain-containing protein [Fimbriimonadaceae bacterium]|nr:HDOD domain-containing protein [Fimbriimonadaceae bacterium]QYK55436.1 MAG: HDOD domain-containing protein [Fimbriimonadaceae bacterium]
MDLASLEIRMSRSENLPVLPQAASTVLRLADDSDASTREMERAIERDAALTAKILRVANSAYYGSPNIPTVGRAISFLGLTTVRSLVVSAAMQQMVSGRSKCESFERLGFWRHCLAVATASRIIGKIRSPLKAEELYCAGLMHDVGILIMDKFMAHELNTIITRCIELKRPLHHVAIEVAGFSHCDVGWVLADRWGLSPMIRRAIRFSVDPISDEEYYETTCVVAAADALANRAGFEHSKIPGNHDVSAEVSEVIGLPPEQFQIIIEVVRQEIDRAQEAFGIAA